MAPRDTAPESLMIKQNDDPGIFAFFNEIGIIAQLSQTSLERNLPDGLKMAHFVVLNHFARLGGERSPAELAEAMQVTRGAMTNTVRKLQIRGLIDVQPDLQDVRGKRVRLTEEGLEVRNEAIAAIGPMLKDIERQFGAGAFETVLPLLQALPKFLDTARNSPTT
jgi:DNA-binding MarR family transcriptional regulator